MPGKAVLVLTGDLVGTVGNRALGLGTVWLGISIAKAGVRWGHGALCVRWTHTCTFLLPRGVCCAPISAAPGAAVRSQVEPAVWPVRCHFLEMGGFVTLCG
jgi:hypothetical protein